MLVLAQGRQVGFNPEGWGGQEEQCADVTQSVINWAGVSKDQGTGPVTSAESQEEILAMTWQIWLRKSHFSPVG